MPQDTLETLRSLRSIHWEFTQKPVSKEDIQIILAHCLCAANNNDRMDLSVIVVDDPKVLDEISGGDSGGRAVTTLFFCADFSRLIQSARALGYDRFTPPNRLYNFLYTMHDISAAAQTAVIAAKSLGIDSLVTNFIHRNRPDRTREILNLPREYCFPVIQVALGYSERDPAQVAGKPSLQHIVHYNRYTPAEEGEIAAYIQESDDIHSDWISEKNPHALDWYLREWRVERYDEDMYRCLASELNDAKLLREPCLDCGTAS